jgi:hypothetical protein
MNMPSKLAFLAKTSYRVVRRPKFTRGRPEVESEYSDGWNQYWDHLKRARTLSEWLRIPGLEPETSFFHVDGELRYLTFDSIGFYQATLLDALAQAFPQATSVTEFGSGLGRNLLFLKTKLPNLNLYGYELCKPGVEIAKEAARKFDVDCHYSQLDYVRDPQSAYVFPVTDVAYTMFSLEQIPRDNGIAIDNIRDHCVLGSIHMEPVPENYPFTFRGLLGKLDHWKVDYLASFDKNVRSIGFSEITNKVLTSSHNPLMFPSLYILRK